MAASAAASLRASLSTAAPPARIAAVAVDAAVRDCARAPRHRRHYHACLRDAAILRSAAFPLYNAATVQEFLDNERVPYPRDPVASSVPPERLCTRLPLATSAALRDYYTNGMGTLRVGKILEDLDALAGSVALRHAGAPDVNTVTAVVDHIRVCPPFSPGARGLARDLNYDARLTYVGRSSMNVVCEVSQMQRDEVRAVGGTRAGGAGGNVGDRYIEAQFVFVARDAHGKRSMVVPQLQLNTEEERALFEKGQMDKERRKELRRVQQLQEQRQHAKEADAQATASAQQQQQPEEEERRGQRQEQFGDARHVHVSAAHNARGKRISSGHDARHGDAVPIGATALSTVHLIQPAQRNLFGFCFGGTIMRWAFELAFVTVVRHGGASLKSLPGLVSVGDIAFHRPVPIGSVFDMRSRIVRVSDDGHRVVVRLAAEAWQAGGAYAGGGGPVSNTMTFVFELHRDEGAAVAGGGDGGGGGSDTVRRVFPETPAEELEHERARVHVSGATPLAAVADEARAPTYRAR